MEDKDYLKEMFECYFRFRKMNSVLPIERLFDAIIGALSGADYPKVVRDDLLSNLISDCEIIKETTQKVKSSREQILNRNIATAPTTIIQDTKPSISDWMNLNEICQEFNLAKNNIKSKEWRDKNKFPYRNPTGGKVTFNRKEVEKWINDHNH